MLIACETCVPKKTCNKKKYTHFLIGATEEFQNLLVKHDIKCRIKKNNESLKYWGRDKKKEMGFDSLCFKNTGCGHYGHP